MLIPLAGFKHYTMLNAFTWIVLNVLIVLCHIERISDFNLCYASSIHTNYNEHKWTTNENTFNMCYSRNYLLARRRSTNSVISPDVKQIVDDYSLQRTLIPSRAGRHIPRQIRVIISSHRKPGLGIADELDGVNWSNLRTLHDLHIPVHTTHRYVPVAASQTTTLMTLARTPKHQCK